MKSIFLIGLLLACSLSTMGTKFQTGPQIESVAVKYLVENLGQFSDLESLGEYDGNFFGNLWNFVEGFLTAIGYNTVVTSETQCNQSVHKFVGAIESGFGAFLDLQIPKAILQFKIASKNYNATVTYCNQTYIEIGRFFEQVGYNWQQAVDTGMGLKRLALHTKQVNTDIQNGKAALKNGDYFSAGSNFGNVLALFLYGNQTETPVLEKAQPEILQQDQEEVKSESRKSYESIATNPLMNNIIDQLVNNPQGKNLIEGILNIASSYMAPALNVYDTDNLN